MVYKRRLVPTNVAFVGFEAGLPVASISPPVDDVAPLGPTLTISWIGEESVGPNLIDRILPILRIPKISGPGELHLQGR